jgi:hypothetical protein
MITTASKASIKVPKKLMDASVSKLYFEQTYF